MLPSKPGFENAGVGGTNVSSVRAIETGWYAPRVSPPVGMPKELVRWRGMGLARPTLRRVRARLLRRRHMYTMPATARTRMTSALRAMIARMAGMYACSLLSVSESSLEISTEVEPEDAAEADETFCAL